MYWFDWSILIQEFKEWIILDQLSLKKQTEIWLHQVDKNKQQNWQEFHGLLITGLYKEHLTLFYSMTQVEQNQLICVYFQELLQVIETDFELR